MSLENLATPATDEAASAPLSGVFVSPTLLPVCCACGLIRDETRSSLHRERWVTPRTYRDTHGVKPSDFFLTHTYCPACFTKVQERVKQYFQEIGTRT
jgi:hypothetical protein